MAKAGKKPPKKKLTGQALRDKMAALSHEKQRLADQRAGRAKPQERVKRKTETAVAEAKYELKEETKVLKNYEKQREILHDRCVAGVTGNQTAKDRFDARQAEIESLKAAYEEL